jgi:hypothetical protein
VAQREHATVSDLDAEVPQERVARALEHPKDMQTPRAEVERARLAVSAIDLHPHAPIVYLFGAGCLIPVKRGSRGWRAM